MIDSHDYRVEIVGSGEKTGFLTATVDSLPEIYVASPPEFGGPEKVWSPEHLFVASIASCLMTTFRSIAARSGVDVLDYTDEAVGRLRRGDDGLYSIESVVLRPSIVISSDSKMERAQRLIEKAEQVCLISRSIRSEVILDASIMQAQPVGL
ncbi:MAG TPA: OsmC family protein [Acidimicrobiia bacterium]|nr:OsmC family protein [Acidimicrobiia bacterium]